MVRLIVLAVGLGAGPVSQQPPPGPSWANKLFLADILKNPAQAPPPVVAHNFGSVPKGTLCQHTFTLTNIYDVPLQVIDTNPGCACLKTYPPQRVLQPAESADFTVTMDTKLLAAGPASRVLKVTVGGQEYQNTAEFRFEVDARTDIMLAPGELNLGTTVTGDRKTAETLLTYQGRQPNWRVTGVKADGPFEVRMKADGPGKVKLTAELKPTAPPGRLTGHVSLTTSDPGLPVVQVPVTGVVLAPVTVMPAAATFSRPVKVGEKDEFSVLILSNGRPFQVRPVADAGDGVSVETFGFAGPTQRVVVRFAPTKLGPVRKELRLETDLPGKPTVTLRVEAVGE